MVPGSPINDKDDEKYFKGKPTKKKEEEKKKEPVYSGKYAKDAVLKEPKKIEPLPSGPAQGNKFAGVLKPTVKKDVTDRNTSVN